MKVTKAGYNFLYHIIFFLAQILVRILYPVRTIGRENLIKRRGFVLAPNHYSAIDPLFVLLARGFGKKVLIMGKGELFHKNFLLDFFWNIVGAFPIERGTGDKAVVGQAVAEVKKGRGLLIFPEGTRNKEEILGRLKSGAFVVAMQAQADIIPCRIWYKAGRAKIFNRITVVFGKPVTMQELGLEGEYSASKLREAKKIFTEKLVNLYEDNKARL